MQTHSGVRKTVHPPEPKHFDWFVGLLYIVGAAGFAAIVILFYIVFTGQASY